MNIERIRHLNRYLRPYSEYPTKKEAEKLPPLIVKRLRYFPNTHLTIIGTHHGRKPDDPQFHILKEEFETWDKKTKREKRVIVIEGRVANIDAIETEESAITSERGETALLALWARGHNIEIVSGEPQPLWSEANQVVEQIGKDPEILAKGLSGREVTVYYYTARRIPQWINTKTEERKELADFIGDVMKEHQNAWKWDDVDFSYENFIRIHKVLYEKLFDPINKEFFLAETADWHAGITPVQRVARLVRSERDKSLANVLTAYWDRGVSVFSAFGRNHVWRNQDAINTLGLADL